MSTPSVTTKSGQKATIKVGREVAFSPDKTFPGYEVGVTLDVLSVLSDSGLLDIQMEPSIVECDGLKTDANGKEKPVLSTRKANARVSLKPGQTVLLDLGTRNDEQRIEEEQADGKVVGRTDRYSRRALVFVTTSLAKSAKAKTEDKGFSTGQSLFRPGDSIKITQVQRGKKFITVTADYELANADRALIALHITSMKDTSGTRNAAEQSKQITRGKGTVTLHHPATYEGMPHVSFYPSPQGGQAFGGIYFGTKDEAFASQKLKLGYLLEKSEAQSNPQKAADDNVAAKLRTAKSQRYDFSKAVLGDVLRYLATDAGLKFISLADDHPAGKRLVTFSLEASPFATLEAICRAHGLALVLDQGAWHISSSDDNALSDRVYPNPGKAQAGAILEDIRHILNIPNEDEKPAADKTTGSQSSSSVTLKEADNSFHITANRLQHMWVEGYLKALERKK
jgi:hypothetical protein